MQIIELNQNEIPSVSGAQEDGGAAKTVICYIFSIGMNAVFLYSKYREGKRALRSFCYDTDVCQKLLFGGAVFAGAGLINGIANAFAPVHVPAPVVAAEAA